MSRLFSTQVLIYNILLILECKTNLSYIKKMTRGRLISLSVPGVAPTFGQEGLVISLNKYFNSCRKNICVDIIDEVGNILHSFDSKVECAKFLGVHPTTVAKRINKGIQFILDNKQVCIKNKVS
jgi:hypothetical protein